MESKSFGVLDTPHARGMTALCGSTGVVIASEAKQSILSCGMDCFAALAMTERRRAPSSLPATNAKRLRKGAQRRSNPFFLVAWIASLRSQ
jgi:hypothetical protein